MDPPDEPTVPVVVVELGGDGTDVLSPLELPPPLSPPQAKKIRAGKMNRITEMDFALISAPPFLWRLRADP